MERRLVVLAAMLAVLVAVAAWTQITIVPAPAQMMKPKITGRVTEKILKEFTDLGVPGVKSVRFGRLTLGPNAKVEPMVAEGYGELCNATRGTVTVTVNGGQKVSHKGGDIFIIPFNMKAAAIQAGPGGYEETFWRIFPAN